MITYKFLLMKNFLEIFKKLIQINRDFYNSTSLIQLQGFLFEHLVLNLKVRLV